MWHILLKVGLGLLVAAWPVFTAWAVIHANKISERHWVANQRALEAARRAARSRALDKWAAERNARLAELGISADQPPSEDGGVNYE